MIKNIWIKFLCYFVFYLVLSLLTFYFFETPFFFETAFAEDVASDTVKKDESFVADDPKKSPKSYSELFWDYRWYLLGTAIVLASSAVVIFYVFSGSPDVPNITPPPLLPPPTPPLLMPHVYSQTITELIRIKPEVCIDRLFSNAMPEVLSVDSNFFHAERASVQDPNFIKGFRVANDFYQIYFMPDRPYAELSQQFWILEAQTQLGKVTFPTQDVTFLYTQVAVIPLDALNYTVYHKVDIVKIIQDPGHPAIPRILTSYLFKDNESGWFQ